MDSFAAKLATSKKIEKYKAKFYQNDGKGTLYISNLNIWFATAHIYLSGNTILVTGRDTYFDVDPFSVVPELPKRLSDAMAEVEARPLKVNLLPTQKSI
jgi:hypothetical protein